MIKVRIDQFWHKHTLGIWIMDYRGNEGFIAKPNPPLEFVPVPPDLLLPEPTFEFRLEQGMELLRGFLDALAENEFMSSKVVKEDKALAALKDNLGDLRKISDRLLGIIEAKP